MDNLGLTPDVAALLMATENAEAFARKKGETWSRLTNTERSHFILTELNRLSWFVVPATDFARARTARLAEYRESLKT